MVRNSHDQSPVALDAPYHAFATCKNSGLDALTRAVKEVRVVHRQIDDRLIMVGRHNQESIHHPVRHRLDSSLIGVAVEKHAVEKLKSYGIDGLISATDKQQTLKVLDTGMMDSVDIEISQDIGSFPDRSCGEPLQLTVTGLHIVFYFKD